MQRGDPPFMKDYYPLQEYLDMSYRGAIIYGDYTRAKVTQKKFDNTFRLENYHGEIYLDTIFQSVDKANRGIYETNPNMDTHEEGEEKEEETMVSVLYPDVGDTIYITSAVWHDGQCYVLVFEKFTLGLADQELDIFNRRKRELDAYYNKNSGGMTKELYDKESKKWFLNYNELLSEKIELSEKIDLQSKTKTNSSAQLSSNLKLRL